MAKLSPLRVFFLPETGMQQGPTTNQLASSASREDIQQVGVAFSKTTRTFVQKADPMLRLLIS